MKVSALCDMEVHVREKGEHEADQVPYETWFTFDIPRSYVKAFEKATSEQDKKMVLQASLKHNAIDKLLRSDSISEGKKRVICRTLVVKEYKIGEVEGDYEGTQDEEVVETSVVKKKRAKVVK